MAENDLCATFERLRQIFQPYLARTRVTTDEPGSLYVERFDTDKPEMFGAVMTKKSYVSFHYMPVYTNPELVQDISSELSRRMQGKSCFNFKRADDPAIADLERLVAATADDHLQR